MKLLLRKEANKSILTDGLSLPKETYAALYELTGKQFDFGESMPVNIIIDNESYDATLKNSNAQTRTTKLLQFRWSMKIGKKMRSLLQDSASKLIADDGGAIKGQTPPISEYVNIYSKNSNTFLFDCHMTLNDDEYKICKDNFTYLAAAKTKPFLILGGFSGTGKSQKVKELAYLTCPDLDDLQHGQYPGNYQLINVKPNWHDSTELLGYYSNIGKRYVVTDFIRFLVKAMKYPLVPFYVCMDEMNLAPVEEYFAEYLSVLESRKIVDGQVVSGALVSADVFDDEDLIKSLKLDNTADAEIIADLRQNGLRLPQNIVVIGTVNMDDTTNSFSRKVIDRAMTFETTIEEINAKDYFSLNNDQLTYKNIACPERFINDQVQMFDVMKDDAPDFKLAEGDSGNNKEFANFINEINKAMGNGKNYINKPSLGVSPFQIMHRVLNETVLYYRSLCVLYPAEATLDKVFNDILMMKVLPRIEGEADRAKSPLEGLQQFITLRCGDDEAKKAIWKDSADKVAYMLRPFQKGGDGFTTFWE